MDMGNRIKELRIAAGLTQTELGEKLGIGSSAVAKYEKGRVKNIKQSTIAKMADIFGCTPSHVMALDDDQPPTSFLTLSDIIKKRRIELQLSLQEVAVAVGVSEHTVSRWESGDIANMRRDKIAKLAEVLRVSPAVIMGWSEDEQEQNSSGIRAELISKLSDLSDTQVELLNSMVDNMQK